MSDRFLNPTADIHAATPEKVESKREKISRLLATMELPNKEQVKSYDTTKWFEAWRVANTVLRSVLEQLDLSKDFCLAATHGATLAGLDFAREQSPPISVYANFQLPQNVDEAVAILYSVFGSGVSHSVSQDGTPGGMLVFDFGSQAKNVQNNTERKTRIEMNLESGIKMFPIKNTGGLSGYIWKETSTGVVFEWSENVPVEIPEIWEKGDTPAEQTQFETQVNIEKQGKLVAATQVYPVFLEESGVKSYIIKENELPKYDEHVIDRKRSSTEDFIHSYDNTLMKRVRVLAAIRIFIEKSILPELP